MIQLHFHELNHTIDHPEFKKEISLSINGVRTDILSWYCFENSSKNNNEALELVKRLDDIYSGEWNEIFDDI